MSGAQPKAGNIAGCITVCAEVNIKAVEKRHRQGWVDEVVTNGDALVQRVRQAQQNGEVVSIAYRGNVVEVWEKFYEEEYIRTSWQRPNIAPQSMVGRVLPGGRGF
jgi:urocanate hydratase